MLAPLPDPFPCQTFFQPRFGVEIEFVSRHPVCDCGDPDCGEYGDDLNDIAAFLYRETNDMVSVEDYNHDTPQAGSWKLTTASSCGLELVSAPIQWHSRHNIHRMFSALAQVGRVTVSCGFHVHHEWPLGMAFEDADIFDRKNFVMAHYWAAYPLIMGMLAPSRLSNHYCKFQDTERWADVSLSPGWNWTDRYQAVNFWSLDRQPTIEFRQHQGTLNGRKAMAWLEVTRNLVTASSRMELTTDERYSLMFEKLSHPTRLYLAERLNEWSLDERLAWVRDRLATITF